MFGNAVVAGATGLVGRELADALVQSGHYERILALVRRQPEPPLGGTEARVIDFEALPHTAEDVTCQHAFCCLGTTLRQAGSRAAFRRVDLDYVVGFAQWARARGCDCFVAVSALGADPSARVFYNRVKGEAEEALKVLGFPRLILLRPSLLVGERAQVRPGERVADLALRPLAPLMLGRLRRYRPISAATVARAMLSLAAQEAAPGVRILESETIAELGSST